MSCKTDIGTCMRENEEVPRRSPGSRSVDPNSGGFWYPLATKISVSEENDVEGKHVDQVVAGESWDTRGADQVDLD